MQRHWRLALRVVITLAVLLWVGRQVAAREVLTCLQAVPWWAFVCPMLLMLSNAMLHAIRTQLLLRATGVNVSLWALYGALLRAVFVGLVLPTGGGELAKVAFVGALTEKPDAALAALMAARLLELIPWAGLLLFGLAYGVGDIDPLLGWAALFFAVLFLSVVTLAFWGAGQGAAVGQRVPGRVGDFLVRASHALVAVKSRRDLMLWALLLAVPFTLCNALAIWTALQGNDIPLRYIDVLAVFPAADTLISLPITINGLGVREGVFVRVLAPWSTTEAQAVSAGLTRWSGELGRAAVGGIWLLVHQTRTKNGVQ